VIIETAAGCPDQLVFVLPKTERSDDSNMQRLWLRFSQIYFRGNRKYFFGHRSGQRDQPAALDGLNRKNLSGFWPKMD
jgi:hypothetical protein